MKKKQKQTRFLQYIFTAFTIIALFTLSGGQYINAAGKKPAKPPAPSVTVSDSGDVVVSLPKKVTDKVDGFSVYVTSNSNKKTKSSSGTWYSSDDYSTDKKSSTSLWLFDDAPGKYYATVRTWNYTKSYNRKYSEYSATTSFKLSWNLLAKTTSPNKITLSLNSLTGPIGTVAENKEPQKYEIYRSNSSNDEYSLIKTIDSPFISDYVDTNVNLGNTYYYKAKAFFYYDDSYDSSNDNNNEPYYILETNVAKGHPGPKSTNSLKSKSLKNNKLKLTWRKASDADGYYLYHEDDLGKQKKITKTSSTSYTWQNRSHSTEYDIIVVPYMNYNGKEITGADSKTFSVVMKYYTSHYDNKPARIWGAKKGDKMFSKYEKKRYQGKPFYPSASKASKQMKSIKIKVWDFKSGKSGQKITKTFSLTVNKKVAPSLKKAFNEIYKGKEKFPINSIGGYSYRKGQHGVGLAVDINPNENAMFENGKAIVGSYYRPGKDPYSIPANGEVAKILNKYGFSQLNNDFMHFSYFGT